MYASESKHSVLHHETSKAHNSRHFPNNCPLILLHDWKWVRPSHKSGQSVILENFIKLSCSIDTADIKTLASDVWKWCRPYLSMI